MKLYFLNFQLAHEVRLKDKQSCKTQPISNGVTQDTVLIVEINAELLWLIGRFSRRLWQVKVVWLLNNSCCILIS